jgi:hypothetical protein
MARRKVGGEFAIYWGIGKKNFRQPQTFYSQPVQPRNEREPSAPNTPRIAGFDLLLHMLHHRHRDDQHERCDQLMQVKRRVENAPRDAHRSERLHHFEIAGR